MQSGDPASGGMSDAVEVSSSDDFPIGLKRNCGQTRVGVIIVPQLHIEARIQAAVVFEPGQPMKRREPNDSRDHRRSDERFSVREHRKQGTAETREIRSWGGSDKSGVQGSIHTAPLRPCFQGSRSVGQPVAPPQSSRQATRSLNVSWRILCGNCTRWIVARGWNHRRLACPFSGSRVPLGIGCERVRHRARRRWPLVGVAAETAQGGHGSWCRRTPC